MIPPLVRDARALAAELGFRYSSTDEVGCLLRTLAASVDDGVIGEIGTGCGVATAWMASALRTDVRLVSIELDEELARRASALFCEEPGVAILCGDWRAIGAHAPFTLLFADAAASKDEDLVALLRPGGVVVLDDFTDPHDWSDARRREGDARRARWLGDERYASIIVGVGRDKFEGLTRAQALIATRL